MANADLPYFPFYPHDFMLDENVFGMSDAGRGIYISMLCHQWEHGSVPANPTFIARLSNSTEERVREELAGALGLCWLEDAENPGRLVNPRLLTEMAKALERNEELREKRSRAGRASAAKRVQHVLNGCCTVVEHSASVSASASEVVEEVKVEGVQGEEPSGKEKDLSVVVMEFPMLGGKSWQLLQSKLDEWLETYHETDMDVLAEVRKARQWLLDNPKEKRKDLARFVGGWLRRGLEGRRYVRLEAPDPDDWDEAKMAEKFAELERRERGNYEESELDCATVEP